jgi:hypothetical protein
MMVSLRGGFMPAEKKVETTTPSAIPFAAMDNSQKLAFVGKACIFFLSGGFIHPNLWRD